MPETADIETKVVISTPSAGDEGAVELDRIATQCQYISKDALKEYLPNLGLGIVSIDPETVELLKEDPAIRETNARVLPAEAKVRFFEGRRSTASPVPEAEDDGDDPYENPAIVRLGIDKLHALNIRGQGGRIGVIDRGFDLEHGAFPANAVRVKEFDGNQWKNVGPVAGASKDHGTHLAGILAARKHRSAIYGDLDFGIAPEATLFAYALKTDDDGATLVEYLLRAFEQAIKDRVRVVCVAIRSFDVDDSSLGRILRKMKATNSMPVVAVGNSNDIASITRFSECLAVGAESATPGKVLSGSARGWSGSRFVPDVYAPGEGIFSCAPDNSYAMNSGTSMAAAQMAGLALLLSSASSHPTHDRLRGALLNAHLKFVARRDPTRCVVPNALDAWNALNP